MKHLLRSIACWFAGHPSPLDSQPGRVLRFTVLQCRRCEKKWIIWEQCDSPRELIRHQYRKGFGL